MSSPDRQRKVVLSPKARQDLVDILRHAGETWGQGEMHICRARMNDALQLVARKPAMGYRTSDLPEDFRVYLVGSHVVVYREQETTVAVVRILHQRTHLTRQD